MCGILSVLAINKGVHQQHFDTSLKQLEHRGPDNTSSVIVDVASHNMLALGHTRLAIFDLSASANQPMLDESSGRHLVYNGEVFNWIEIRKELESLGYHFKTESDTEVILKAYDFWGEACVERFNGFWSFVLHDPVNTTEYPSGKLFVSRDRVGIKPLYYQVKDNEIVLSSEIKPISRYFDTELALDMPNFSRFIVFRKSHDQQETLYKDIMELEPGKNLTICLGTGQRQIKSYWSLESIKNRSLSDQQALDEFEYLIEDAVALRFRSDRDVSLTLSGGIDSSVIAVAATCSGKRNICTFTSSFPDHPEIDETAYASQLAKALKLNHVLVSPDTYDLEYDEAALSRSQELFYESFSQLVNWAVSKQIQKQGAVVYLNGQGGDELFMGYERYFMSWLMDAKHKPGLFFKRVNEIAKHSGISRKKVASYVPYFYFTSLRKVRYVRNAGTVFNRHVLQSLEQASEPASIPVGLRDLQKQEICGQQLRRLLRYDDRTSSAFGLESRPPFLDHRIIEFAYSLGWEHKIRNGWTKFLLRQYLDRKGFREHAWRKSKLGYPAPTGEWTKQLIAKVPRQELFEQIGGVLKDDLVLEKLNPGMLFKLYNLFSTSKQLAWRI